MDKKTIVFTYGAFDCFHEGHLILLERAKALGDTLIVAIVSDFAINLMKGDPKPIQKQGERMRIVGALKCVDMVVPMECYDDAKETIQTLEKQGFTINILCKGKEPGWQYTPGWEYIVKNGGQFIQPEYTEGFSTSAMIKKIKGEVSIL